MQCSSCYLKHPESHAACTMEVYLDPAQQASSNVSHALFFTQDCAKAIAKGFERFERKNNKVNAIILGKSYEIFETTGFKNSEVMEISEISSLIIKNMKATVFLP